MTQAFAWCAGPAAVSGLIPSVVPSRVLPAVGVWLALARRALAAERYPEALRCFDGALAHEPRLALAHLGRALCLSQLGRETEASEATAVVLDAARGQEEVLYHLARMCAQGGHVGIGASLLHDAVRAVPRLEERAVADPLFADHPAYLMAMGKL